MTVADLLARISSRELSEWMAYERIAGPLGGRRHDVLAGIIAATIANTNRGKGRPPASVSKFVPEWDDHPAPPPPEELLAKARQINAALGGTESRG